MLAVSLQYYFSFQTQTDIDIYQTSSSKPMQAD